MVTIHIQICILGCVWLGVKYFQERKIFSNVWLHFKKCFGKYFLVYGCVLENTIENTFSIVAHIFSHFLSFQINI